ncbi:MAG: Nif3-like dinuclear metal center hexameric protein [Nanoarchaeota archaeon]|nr:Nif3-like dinuclear metal center hexameric protein [Nanoarchaeota archaeon]MBU1631913.1 Nif3-like dinuclear metal center hexameric protein [Nanoarchaeota archaeon]MBU1875564.1 Nif3-like dinuclear metal center hexameric protein [Nanoarchaeota archaeon]
MVKVEQISKLLDEELDINSIEDNSCNGLQVENTGEITKIGFAVDACIETFEKAVISGCQMLVVHHGMIWDGIKFIKGDTYKKIKYLMDNNLALYAAHLPLDMHNKYGNNIKLAEMLNLQEIKNFGYHNGKTIGFSGNAETSLEEVKRRLEENNIKTQSLDFGPNKIKKIAIVSGGASKDVFQAVAIKADLYITGEPLHFAYHFAKENKINVIFGGHYETEVWGVKALMPLLKEKFNVEVEFIDVPTSI